MQIMWERNVDLKENGIHGCEKTHNRLLHREMLNADAAEFQPATEKVFNRCNTTFVPLRTIPVILKTQNRELKINALLDDGSTKSYLNGDVARELGLNGKRSSVEINVINGKSERIDTSLVNFTLESENRNTYLEMEAQTMRNVTGKLKPVNWRKNAEKWSHLQGIRFPAMSKKSKIDLLIWLDYVELHRSLGEIQGGKDEPVARLTPLCWTCVGPIESDGTNFFTFHLSSYTSNRIDETLQRFWDIENEGIVKSEKLSIKDKSILS